MPNNFLAITSAMMVTLKQNLAYIGTHKELIVLNILKYICHVTILLKILNY